MHRYPFSGTDNAKVTLEVVEIEASSQENTAVKPSPVSLELGGKEWRKMAGSEEYYLVRAGWWADGSIMAQVMNRAQSFLQLLRFNVVGGAREVLLEERCSPHCRWLNLHDMLHPLTPTWRPKRRTEDIHPADFYFLWASSRSGFPQVYLYRFDSLKGVGVCQNNLLPLGSDGSPVNWSVDRYHCHLFFLVRIIHKC